MTIETTITKAKFIGNGAATTFPLPFPVLRPEHVYLVTSTADASMTGTAGLQETAVPPNQYTVSGCGTDDVAVTYKPGGKPLAAGVRLTIYRLVPHVQQTDLENGGDFDAEVIESEFDDLVMQIQQLREMLSRAILVPIGSDKTPEQLLAELLAAADAAARAEAAADRAEAAARLADLASLVTNTRKSWIAGAAIASGGTVTLPAVYYPGRAHMLLFHEGAVCAPSQGFGAGSAPQYTEIGDPSLDIPSNQVTVHFPIAKGDQLSVWIISSNAWRVSDEVMAAREATQANVTAAAAEADRARHEANRAVIAGSASVAAIETAEHDAMNAIAGGVASASTQADRAKTEADRAKTSADAAAASEQRIGDALNQGVSEGTQAVKGIVRFATDAEASARTNVLAALKPNHMPGLSDSVASTSSATAATSKAVKTAYDAAVAAAPATVTLTDAAASSALPAATSSTLAALMQTTRNCLKWLTDKCVDATISAAGLVRLANGTAMRAGTVGRAVTADVAGIRQVALITSSRDISEFVPGGVIWMDGAPRVLTLDAGGIVDIGGSYTVSMLKGTSLLNPGGQLRIRGAMPHTVVAAGAEWIAPHNLVAEVARYNAPGSGGVWTATVQGCDGEIPDVWPIDKGGHGKTTAAEAREALGAFAASTESAAGMDMNSDALWAPGKCWYCPSTTANRPDDASGLCFVYGGTGYVKQLYSKMAASTASANTLWLRTKQTATGTITGWTKFFSDLDIIPAANGGTGNSTGNAATATKLASARTISLTGAVTGSATFDGSANASITTSLGTTGGAAPKPQTAAGVGQWIYFEGGEPATGSSYTLPSGGTWAWFAHGIGGGVAAGGTRIINITGGYVGFAWRIA